MSTPRTLTVGQIDAFHASNPTLCCPACGWTGQRAALVQRPNRGRVCPGCEGARFQILAYAARPAGGQA